jgi:hypothetical protein
MTLRIRRVVGWTFVTFAICAPILHADQRAAITLSVDATEVSGKILHARLIIPAEPGPLALLYPKWLPGEHGPTGPIADVAGLVMTAAGAPIPWQRDSLNMYALHCTVPAGAHELEVRSTFCCRLT